MKSVVKGDNTYKALNDIENLKAIVQHVSSTEIKIEIKATLFSENDPNFAFACNNLLDEFEIKLHSDLMSSNSSGEVEGVKNNLPIKLKIRSIRIFRPITPDSSLRVTIESKKEPLQFIGVLKILSDKKVKQIKSESGIVKL